MRIVFETSYLGTIRELIEKLTKVKRCDIRSFYARCYIMLLMKTLLPLKEVLFMVSLIPLSNEISMS